MGGALVSRGAPRGLLRVVRRFATPTTFYRFTGTGGVNDDGYEVPAQEQEIRGRAYIHGPGRSVQKTQDGGTRVARVHGYTDALVRATDQVTRLRGDRVLCDGVLYEIEAVTLWAAGPYGNVRWWEFDAVGVQR